MSETASPSRRGRLLRIAAALVVLLALAGYVVAQYLSGGGGAPRCVVRAQDASGDSGSGDSPSYEMSPEQAANAATISAVGTSRGLPERAVTIALATALQESALRNLNHGDRDSLGLFQQRPSKGWGTAAQIQDPVYSAGQFYDHLAQVPGYSRLPLTEAAQRVQRSGFPQAYAKHEPDAALLAAALTGRSAASLTCSSPNSARPGDPAKVRAALERSFGPGLRAAGSGAEVSVPVSATTGAEAEAGSPGDPAPGEDGEDSASRRGWELAHWAVAQAAVLRIEEVSYGDRVWSAEEADKGWRHAEPSKAATEEVRLRTAR
ncbi:hypothetical protein KQY30_11935 [Streptomyces sp. GMY02]|uniref:hypothetical protein n=1 Tax=Streptomyces sp. GMY02 TaxID=1333528 RepID=UPI001C2BA907|nr:hypothetical protein [Streptomyces sp. GMY02]QXE34878.1 hypothetical protein KQY30_11935 [Streptomyces sp. GMY02]